MTTISGEGDCDAATQRVAVFGASGGIRAALVAALAAPFQRGVPAERLFLPPSRQQRHCWTCLRY